MTPAHARFWRRSALLLLTGFLAALVVGGWHAGFQHWLAVHTGTLNEPGPYYAFWSGFGSDLGEYVILASVLTAVAHSLRKHNCHEPQCWRIGRYPAAGGAYVLCHRHHPDLMGKKPTHEMIHSLHDWHRRHHGAPPR